MIEIASFPNNIDAEIAKGLLESHGINASTNFDGFNQLWPTGGVRVYVAEEDVVKAKAILEQDNSL